MTRLHELLFQPIGKRVSVATGTTVFEAARRAGIGLTTACGGEGRCGLCRVQIVEGDVAEPGSDERAVLGTHAVETGLRLSCRIEVDDDLHVQIPATSLVSGPRLQLGTSRFGIEPDPLVTARTVSVTPPSLEDPRGDVERLLEALATQHGLRVTEVSPAVIRTVGPEMRHHDWRVEAFVRDEHLVGVAQAGESPIGLAVDLGTTKIAAHLIELATGEDLGAAGVPNPQIAYGEDVISRLDHSRRAPNGSGLLASIVRDAIDELLGTLVERAGRERAQVVDVCIVGNTAMVHLLMGYPVSQLVRSPFVAAADGPTDTPAVDLGLRAAPGANVHIPGSIGGFVGADHVAMIVGADLDRTTEVTLGIDIGTNTEIALHRPGGPPLTVTSCASGPAFEGAHIVDGMRAAAGAIERLDITDEGPDYLTIDGVAPIGLCGSGIVDAVSALHRRGIVDGHGRFHRDHPWVVQGGHGPELVLAPASASGSGRDIVISQHDVNEIQLAKGAIHAGVEILLESTSTEPADVDTVLIAGAFGSFLRVESALDIGLLPHLPRAGYRQVGNAAMVGAGRILLSRSERLRAVRIARQTAYEELTVQPTFQRRFALGMLFPDSATAASRQMETTA